LTGGVTTAAGAMRDFADSKLIVTADDFGRDEACTVAIADSLAAGTLSATSIMANATHFEMACRLAHSRGLAARVGVHVVLDEGPPLSPEMCRFVDAQGNLCVSRKLRPLGSKLAAAIEAECAAQISRVVAAGIRPAHVDSHRHIHTVFPIGRIVVGVARDLGVPYVRPARNLTQRTKWTSSAYKWLFNRYVASRVRTADYFGDIEDFVAHDYRLPPSSLVECMVHLDDSPRGQSGRRLLESDEFRQLLRRYALVDHAAAGH
jgi:predicted glycoside hydrolase/deacetylase ChbG (UPF0249 family)